MLMKRLESQVFTAMQKADSPLYEPGLALLLVGKKKKQKQDQNNICCILTSVPLKPFGHNESSQNGSLSTTLLVAKKNLE